MSAILKQKLIDIANGFTKYGLWKGGSSKLSELDDVTLTNLQSNDVLTYNGSVWVNDDNLQKQIDTLNSNLANLINGFSNVNINGTISYMQIGKLVIVRLINHPISKTFTLDVPNASSSLVVSLRDEINGKFARFWFTGEGIDVYMAENYTSGNKYSGQFCYISI